MGLTRQGEEGILAPGASIAQLVEHEIRNFGVLSSNLSAGSTPKFLVFLPTF